MNVSDILDLMGDFSIGGGNVSDTQRSLFLKYLNLYQDDLYSRTALFNETVSSVEVFNDAYDSDNGIVIAGSPMMVSSVFDLDNKFYLKRKSKSEATNIFYSQTGMSAVYSVSLNQEDITFSIFLYPVPSTPKVSINWVKNPLVFTETTLSQDIPFPEVFHQVLVDGGLWYVFQEEGGFRDALKARESKARCMTKEHQLISFLMNSFEDQGSEMNGV